MSRPALRSRLRFPRACLLQCAIIGTDLITQDSHPHLHRFTFVDILSQSKSHRTMRRFIGKSPYPNLLEAEKNGEIEIAYDPRHDTDRAPGWRAREKERMKEEQLAAAYWETLFAARKQRKERDDLERQLRDQREKEGRALSLIVPIHGGGDGLRSSQAGARGLPVQQDRSAAQHGWGLSTRPEYRAELHATSSNNHATRPYELEASSSSQQFNSNTQSRQRSMQQDQPRRTAQRFELMGNVPGDPSHPAQPTSGHHAGTYQQNYHNMAPLQPQERQRDHAPYQPQAIIEGRSTRGQRPIQYPPGFFEDPRTPPDISKYNRPPSELKNW